MTPKGKITLICVVLAAVVAIVVIPPFRTYTPDSIVQSVISEVIISSVDRPDIEWTKGARKFWQNHPAEVSFYGVEEISAQNRIVDSVRKHLRQSDIPDIAIRFFSKGRTPTHTVPEIRYILIQK